MKNNFSKYLAEGADNRLTMLLRVLNGPQMKFLVTVNKKGEHTQLLATMGGYDVGSVWFRDHGGSIGIDISEPKGIFDHEKIYELVRTALENTRDK